MHEVTHGERSSADGKTILRCSNTYRNLGTPQCATIVDGHLKGVIAWWQVDFCIVMVEMGEVSASQS